MKKRIALLWLMTVMVSNLTACGKQVVQSDNTDTSVNAVEENTEDIENSIDEEEDKESEVKTLEDWGVSYDYVCWTGEEDTVNFGIRYPSLVPTSDGIAYQMDPTLVMVGSATGGAYNHADGVEDVLSAYMGSLIFDIDFYREWNYDTFAFNIESKEAVTINDFPMCKYTGTHTFRYDEEPYEIPFVAYSVDLLEKSEAYMYLMVFDESALYPDRDAVKDGVIEEYAYKMAQSIYIRK